MGHYSRVKQEYDHSLFYRLQLGMAALTKEPFEGGITINHGRYNLAVISPSCGQINTISPFQESLVDLRYGL